ncbi:TPA: class A sortase [Enterococcus faecium]
MSLGQMLSIQKEAIEMGVNKQAFAQIQIPALGLTLPIFKGANQYTLSLGAATYFYEDAEMRKGNYVLAGHNMEMPGVLFSDIQKLSLGEVMDLVSNDGVYRYKVTRKFIVPEYFKFGMATVFLTNFIRCRTSFRMLFRLSLTMSLLGCDDLRQELTIKVRLPR